MKNLCLLKMVCVLALFFATPFALQAQTFSTIVNFNETNGAGPSASLVQGANGNLYGTAGGGSSAACVSGCGIIFAVTPSGNLKTLYDFCSKTGCPDGSGPQAGLVLASNGNFYGTTAFGGSGTFSSCNGCGTIFEITPSGKLVTLYSFCSQTNCTDGGLPVAALVLGTGGNFYGTTEANGANGGGTIFKITPGGKLTTLYSFCTQTNCTDGKSPTAALVQYSDGNLYGTTKYGGANGGGTIFEITSQGVLTTLYSFCAQTNCADGSGPQAGLVLASNGNFYGTTVMGGTCGLFECGGTVFEITPTGTFSSLYDFCTQENCTDGLWPYAGLMQGTDGNLYGTTEFGGSFTNDCSLVGGCGTVFEITLGGGLTTLHSFSESGTDGGIPYAGVVQSTNGSFYGTTTSGGSGTACLTGCGTVFSLSVGLDPFVETVPTSAKVGAAVAILGNNLKGATGVSFNGTAATFTVVSNSEIKATVPKGATTGTVAVTTPAGILTSNVPFQVITGGGTKIPTSTVLTTSSNPAYENLPVLFTATVSSSDGTPSGIVTFKSGTTVLGTVGLSSSGVATLTETFAKTGIFSITAAYTGDSLFAASSASVRQQVVRNVSKTPFYTFTGTPDGATPYAGLIIDAGDNLYGTTNRGGAYDSGTVFKVNDGGIESVLSDFSGGGELPRAGLILDTSGNLYGTTQYGGSYGYGTVFEVSASGTESVLYSFTGGSDGANPTAGSLLIDGAGNLYGTTPGGGNLSACPGGCGVVFSLSPTGSEAVLHSFAGGADGADPLSGLVQDSAGNLYGTAYEGGNLNYCSGFGCGTLFTIAANSTYSVLYSFTGVNGDGNLPVGNLIRDSQGNLYGVTEGGGASGGGAVFKYSAAGVETVLYSFKGGTDGATPLGGVIQDSAGNFYGTTYGGGLGYGTVYELSASGQETVLYTFTGANDGSYPWGSVARDSLGNLYGTTSQGGADGDGVVFKLTP